MGKLIYNQMSFTSPYVERRKIKDDFFRQINCIINWDKISIKLEKYYQKGSSVAGRKSYPALLLFKMSLLQTWYGLSDYEIETQVNDRISFMKFCKLRLEDIVPDHSAICRFRKELTKQNAYEALLEEINNQLESHSILLKKGVIIDASITPSERKPKGKKLFKIEGEITSNEKSVSKDTPILNDEIPPEKDTTLKIKMATDEEKSQKDNKYLNKESSSKPEILLKKGTFSEKEKNTVKLEELIKKGVDQEASWTKKGGKYHYGYKKHYLCDESTSIVLSVVTSTAKDHDSKYMENCLSKVELSKGSSVLADKGYYGTPNEEMLKKKGLKSRIQTKAVRGKALTYWEKKRNKLISKSRYKVERIFGGIKKWFKSGTCRYVGNTKTHSQHVLEALAYNLKISPGLIISKATG